MASDLVIFNVKMKIPRNLRETLQTYCDAEGVSVAEVTRAGLKMYLEAQGRMTVAATEQNRFANAVEHVGRIAGALTALAELGKKE